MARYRDGSGGALIHKARSHTSNTQLIFKIREYVIGLVAAISIPNIVEKREHPAKWIKASTYST